MPIYTMRFEVFVDDYSDFMERMERMLTTRDGEARVPVNAAGLWNIYALQDWQADDFLDVTYLDADGRGITTRARMSDDYILGFCKVLNGANQPIWFHASDVNGLVLPNEPADQGFVNRRLTFKSSYCSIGKVLDTPMSMAGIAAAVQTLANFVQVGNHNPAKHALRVLIIAQCEALKIRRIRQRLSNAWDEGFTMGVTESDLVQDWSNASEFVMAGQPGGNERWTRKLKELEAADMSELYAVIKR